MPSVLTGKQKRYLRSLAHAMKPIVNIGKGGISEALVKQVDQALLQHELIKVKVLEASPQAAQECAEELTQQTNAHIAQIIGRTLILYRTHPETPVIVLPKS